MVNADTETVADVLRGARGGVVQTTAYALIYLCHEDLPSNALADVATEAIEGVGDLAALYRDEDTEEERVAAAATELFEILSKVEGTCRE